MREASYTQRLVQSLIKLVSRKASLRTLTEKQATLLSLLERTSLEIIVIACTSLSTFDSFHRHF